MTYYIHVSRGVIDSNRKNGTDNPPVAFRRGKSGKATYAFEIEMNGPCKVVYSPHKPILRCGARLVIMTEEEPTVVR